MKKSVVILIALIYVSSIALVGFLGLQAKSYNEVVYVESIEVLSDYAVDTSTLTKYITVYGESTLQLECRVLPDKASNKKIIYKLPKGCTNATIDENGLLTFVGDTSKYFSVTVYINSDQNTTISDKILIYYVPSQ